MPHLATGAVPLNTRVKNIGRKSQPKVIRGLVLLALVRGEAGITDITHRIGSLTGCELAFHLIERAVMTLGVEGSVAAREEPEGDVRVWFELTDQGIEEVEKFLGTDPYPNE